MDIKNATTSLWLKLLRMKNETVLNKCACPTIKPVNMLAIETFIPAVYSELAKYNQSQTCMNQKKVRAS